MKSLLVLKDVLHLDWIDLYGPAKGNQNYDKVNFSEEEIDAIHTWNFYDDKIYEYFHKRFMESELAYIGDGVDKQEKKISRLYEYCAANKKECELMWEESAMVNKLKHHENEEWNEDNVIFSENPVDYKGLVKYMQDNRGRCEYG